MLYFLKIEWKKFYKNTVFRVLAILYMLVMPGIFTLLYIVPKPEIAQNEMQGFFMFPNIWKYVGFLGNWSVFFLFGFAMILSITTEYSNKTLRQNIITGMTRRDFFLSKLTWAIALSIGATTYYALTCTVIGFLQTDTFYLSKFLQEINYVPRFFLMSLGFMSIAFLFGLLFRRTGLSLVIYLMYNIALEPLFRYAVHMRFFKNKSMHFYPMNSMEDLVPVPFVEMLDEFMTENKFTFLLEPSEAILTAGVYTVLIFGCCYWLLQRRDL
ncbi:MAG: ABC transporter permease subunit [Saprospiraceae bacterium]